MHDRWPAIAVAQTGPRLGDVTANLADIERIVAASSDRADLIVFPELFTIGYRLASLSLADLAESIPEGVVSRQLASIAARFRVGLIGTIVERDGERLYDTAIVIDRDGRFVETYRKTHLYPAERSVFAAGDRLTVVQVDGISIGLAICFEHAFPEIFTELALLGAQLIVIPSAVPRGFEYLLDLRTRARAQDNQVFVAAANLAGGDGQTEWCGHSRIVDPRGEVMAAADDAPGTIIWADLDLRLIDRERRQEPVLHHRRPSLYSHLREPEADRPRER
jgi:predicted amidohydrolase